MKSTDRDEPPGPLWPALRYVAGEMEDAEAVAFERRLACDPAACAAVARAVELGTAVARIGWDPAPSVPRRSRRGVLAIPAAVALVLGLAWCFLTSTRPEPVGALAQVPPDVVAMAWADLRREGAAEPGVPGTESPRPGTGIDCEPGAPWALATEPDVPSWMVELAALVDERPSSPEERREN